MGFVTGSSCLLPTPFFSQSSTQCPLNSPFLCIYPRTVKTQRKRKGAMACVGQEISKENSICKRRAILLMGFAVIPLLNMRAEAIEAETTELSAQDQEQKLEQPTQRNPSTNPFFSLLNALGFLSSGVLAALYASTLKEKETLDATVQSMNIKLKEKAAAMTSLEKKFEADLLNEKEIRNQAQSKAKEEQQALLNRLELANSTIMSLGQELKKEKRVVEELTARVESLEVSLHKAGEEKKELEEQLKEKLNVVEMLQQRIDSLALEIKDKEENLRNLNSKFAEKEREFNHLSSVYQQSQDQLAALNSDIKQLNDVIQKNKEELELKNDMVRKLNSELASSLAKRDEFREKLNAILKEYNDLKSSTEMKAASDAKLLEQRVEEISSLEEQLKVALDEVEKNKVSIANLTEEKDKLQKMLNVELENVKNLEHELRITQETLEKSRDEASDLAKQLQQSRHLCSELEVEISKVRAEFNETRESFQKSIDEAKEGSRILAEELKSANELLSKSNEELLKMSQELAAAVEKSEKLEEELVNANKKAETAADDLKEEKKIISSLNKELEVLETQISKDKEARKGLEADLEEATRSLDEMNRSALMLSKDLELANSKISSLEYEKDALYKSLDEQKQVTQEARENLEDAHNLVMKLGKERESLENRGNKLEEELASAKGEILRLRSQINSSKTPVNSQPKQIVDVKDGAPVPTRKVTRRRKVINPPNEES